MTDLWQNYLEQNLEAIATMPEIPDALKGALGLHWRGDLAAALAIYDDINGSVAQSSWPEQFRRLASVDHEWVAVKLGRGLLRENYLSVGSDWRERMVVAYVRYTHFFWVDHKRAWKELWSYFFLALCGRSSGIISAIFLIGHMRAIQGHRLSGDWLTSLVVEGLVRALERGYKPLPIAKNIVLSSYPYTRFVLGKPLGVVRLVSRFGDKIPNDPYYQVIFQISCLYAFSYAGDVVRTEFFAARFRQLHQTGKLIRYQPLSKIMPLMPMALRGYGFVGERRFDELIAEHKEDQSDNLINSQFYRSAAVIAFCMGRFAQTLSLMEKAIHYRTASRSFQAWASFDRRVINLAEKKTVFDPMHHKFLNESYRFASAHGLAKLFLHLTSRLQLFTENPNAFPEFVFDFLKEHLGDCHMTFVDHVPDSTLVQRICLSVRSRFIVIQPPAERYQAVAGMIETLSPAIVAVDSMVSEVQRLNHRLEESSKLEAIARTTQMIAHDVRRPFAIMRMGLKTLSSLDLPRPAAEWVDKLDERVKSSFDQVDSLLSDILHFGRRPALSPRACNMRELVAKVVDDLHASDSEDRPRVNMNIARDAVACIDVKQIERVIANLLANAQQAMTHEGVITISNRQLQLDDGHLLEFMIHNTHSLVKAEDLTRIFEPYYTKGKVYGTGLGLAIVRQIVEAHGGQIRCESSLENGTSFIFTVPASDVGQAHAPSLELQALASQIQ